MHDHSTNPVEEGKQETSKINQMIQADTDVVPSAQSIERWNFIVEGYEKELTKLGPSSLDFLFVEACCDGNSNLCEAFQEVCCETSQVGIIRISKHADLVSCIDQLVAMLEKFRKKSKPVFMHFLSPHHGGPNLQNVSNNDNLREARKNEVKELLRACAFHMPPAAPLN